MQPGFWESVFLGVDINGDGIYGEGERGILLVAFYAVANISRSFGDVLLSGLFAALPAEYIGYQADVAKVFEGLNAWVPLDYTMSLVLIRWAFLISFSTVKMVLKLIPTIG